MTTTLSPQDCVQKWKQAELKERSSAQEHFIDLCRLFNHLTPPESDPEGARCTFEAGANKQAHAPDVGGTAGGQGWADVWEKGYFAWEYKGKHADVDAAYQQLLQDRESLDNPPLLIVSDIERILIHTNFTNKVKKVYEITLDGLLELAHRRLDETVLDAYGWSHDIDEEKFLRRLLELNLKRAELQGQSRVPEPNIAYIWCDEANVRIRRLNSGNRERSLPTLW